MTCKLIKSAFFILFLIPQLSFAEDNIKQFAEKYIQAQKNAWENGNFDGLKALEDPNISFRNIDGMNIAGRDAHIKAIMSARPPGAEIKQDWKYLMGDVNMFCLSYKWTFKLPGNTIRINGLMVGRVKNGKLIEEWGADIVSFTAQQKK